MTPPAGHGSSTLRQTVQPTASSSAKQPCNEVNEAPKQKATIKQIQALMSEIKELDFMIEPYLLKG